MSISLRAKNALPSPTLAITAKAKALKAEGKDVVGFGAGEPFWLDSRTTKLNSHQSLQSKVTLYGK